MPREADDREIAERETDSASPPPPCARRRRRKTAPRPCVRCLIAASARRPADRRIPRPPPEKLCGPHRSVPAGTPTTNISARSASPHERVPVRRQWLLPRHDRDAGKPRARDSGHGRAARSRADRSGGPAPASAPSPARRRLPGRRRARWRAIRRRASSIWSVPSAASTASTCLPATTTACPISNGAAGVANNRGRRRYRPDRAPTAST